MLFAFLYACLRLMLDLADVRLRRGGAEAELLLLRHELRVLRREVRRPRLRPSDRAVMAAFSRRVAGQGLAGLVRPETVVGWHRELVRRKWAAFGRRPRVGRPRIDQEVRELILRRAKENSTWGCVRIRGELLKLGHRVSATAIRQLLRRERLGPAPLRSRLSWRSFLKAQASTIVLSDFFSVDTVWELSERGAAARFLIHDHDAKYSGSADAVFAAEGIAVLRTPIAAPRANAHMERQIGSTRRECLDWVLILGRRHLEGVMAEWIKHYNQARPHRGLALQTPSARSDPGARAGPGVCHQRLGGLLRDYSRAPMAAAA